MESIRCGWGGGLRLRVNSWVVQTGSVSGGDVWVLSLGFWA
jgi:hypothetical protein